MRKTLVLAVVSGAAVTAALVAPGAAQAAPSSQDKTFMMKNEQVNLAELSLATLGDQRGSASQTRMLVQMTRMDHTKAKAEVTALAHKLGTTLPTAPNAMQKQQAAQLAGVAASKFDLMYAQIQVAGHQMSIADTQQEISSGSDAQVVAYAKAYLPVAQKHLTMAQDEVSALGGDPSAVPAGTGGAAAPAQGSQVWQVGVLAGVLLLGAAAVPSLRRRRSSSRA